LPGTDADKKALGYLHANCGMCHNDFSKVYNTKASLDFWSHLGQLQSVPQTRAFLSTVCDQWPGPDGKGSPITSCEAGHLTGAPMDNQISKPKRIVPTDTANSSVHDLMSLRITGQDTKQMPPLGTEMVDATGLAAVDAWINSLPTQ
jgi:hypothetical protein